MSTWHSLLAAGALLTFSLAVPGTATAAWPDNVAQQILVNASGFNLETGSAPDGAGGIITVFHHYNGATGQDIHARRYNNLGQLVWGSGPLIICDAPGDQINIRVVPTSGGGCFILWSDPRNGNYDVYVQKLAPSGQTLFTANGANYIAGPANSVLQAAIADDFDGFIMAYQEGSLINSRRFNNAGNSVWASPANISDTSGDVLTDMISDGTGGFYAGLERVGIGSEVVIQPVSAAGVPDFDQLLSQNAVGSQRGIRLARRANGNVLAVWYDSGGPARLMTNEFVDPLVFNPNIPLNTGNAIVLDDFRLMASQVGDPIILYANFVNANDTHTFAGRVAPSGQLVFNTLLPGIGLSQSPDNLTETPAGNIRVTYKDFTTAQNNRKLIAAQLSPTGQYQWHQQITPSDASFKSTPPARLIHGSQESLIVFSTQVLIPGTKTAALIRVRANGTLGGELALPDLAFAPSTLTATRTNRKATLIGDLVVRNGGTVPSNDTTLHFYASPSPDPAVTGRVFLFEVAVPILQPGEQVILNPGLRPPKKPGKQPKVRKIKLPKEVKLTPHYLLIFAVPPDFNAEIDENNNFYLLGPV